MPDLHACGWTRSTSPAPCTITSASYLRLCFSVGVHTTLVPSPIFTCSWTTHSKSPALMSQASLLPCPLHSHTLTSQVAWWTPVSAGPCRGSGAAGSAARSVHTESPWLEASCWSPTEAVWVQDGPWLSIRPSSCKISSPP